jgi:hypothetical protein
MAPSVLRTLGLTLGFIAAHAKTLVRLAWFPVLVLSVANVFIRSRLVPLQGAVQSGDPALVEKLLAPELGFVVLYLAVSLATSSTAATAVLRFVAAGEGRSSRAWAYLPPGAPTLRVAGVAFLIGVLSFLVLAMLAILVGMLAAYVPAIAMVATPLLAIALAAVATRWLLAFPIAAVEGRIDLAGAWALTRPIYRQLLSLVLATTATIMILDVAFDWLLIPRGTTSAKEAAKLMAERWPVAVVARFAANLISIIGMFALIGIVYRVRKEDRERPAASAPPAGAQKR